MKYIFQALSVLSPALAITLPAAAYNGPGLGLATIAVVLGIIGSIFFWLFSALWYPIKRALKKKKSDADADLDELATSEQRSGDA